jgi:hypothetical protein
VCVEETQKMTPDQAMLNRTAVFPCHVRYFVVMMMMLGRGWWGMTKMKTTTMTKNKMMTTKK